MVRGLNESLSFADFDTPAMFADTVVVGISHPTADDVGSFIAVTEEESSFYSSKKCGDTKPLKLTDMGLPEFRHLINLVVDTNLSVEDQRFDSFTLHPNPARDFLKLSLPPSEIQRIDLYDSSGKKLECSYHNNIVDVSTLMDGIYFLTINTAATVLTKRFIKQ